MKKILVLLASAALFASCGVQRTVLPRAVNTVNTAPLGDLNLQRGDYEILNTITAEASITYKEKGSIVSIADTGNEFTLMYAFDKKTGVIADMKYSGILRLGYLANDYVVDNETILRPEEIARRLAIYRAINVAKEYGADAVVEPTIATNIEQVGKNEVVYKTTVTAKIIKLKTDR